MKLKAIPVLLLCMLCLLGCQKQEEAPEPPARVAVCFRQQSESTMTEYTRQVQSALTGAGYEVLTADAKNDQSKQNTQISGFITDGVKLLVVEPVMVSAAAEVIAQAKAANIPILFINREPEAQDLQLWEKTGYVGCNAELASCEQGHIVLQTPDKGDINGDGIVSYVVISGPADDLDAQARTQHCAELLTEAGVAVELLEAGHGDWSNESGQRECQRLLSCYGKDIEVVFCNNDAMAVGALEAIREGGRQVGRDIYLVGCDAQPEALALVGSGGLTGTVTTDPALHAEQIARVAGALLNGQPVQKQYYIEYEGIGRDNVETFLKQG